MTGPRAAGGRCRTRPFAGVGDVKFGPKGEWAQSRVLQVQFQGTKGNDIAQFRDVSTQVVLTPAEYKTGEVIYPYANAK
jgi:branched-chain amino acid transport system substrate-binding protein